MPEFAFPTASEHAPEETWTAVPSEAPVETCFGNAALQVALSPEPPSAAEKPFRTAVLYHPAAFGVVVGPLLLIDGALRSILFPPMSAGAAAQLFTPSQALFVPAEAAALDVSIPPATCV